jgi:hypothetical protein
MVRDKDGEINGKKISDLTTGSSLKINWKCDNGFWPDRKKPATDHEWTQEISARWNPKKQEVRQCPFCMGKRTCESNSAWAHSLYEPRKYGFLEQWHDNDFKNSWRYYAPTGNEFLSLWECIGHKNPKQVRPQQHDRKNTTFLWKCNVAEDHVWFSTVANRTRGRQCPFCNGDFVALSNSISTMHPNISKEWHPTRNGFSNPCCYKANSKKYKPWWKCYDGTWPDEIRFAEDHVWHTMIPNRTRGSGCPFCKNASGARSEVCYSNSLEATHPELAKLWSSKNKSKPSQVLKGNNTDVWWNCDKDESHEYLQSPKSKTTQNAGCISCKNKNETKVFDYCVELFPHLEENICRNQSGLLKQNPRMHLDIWIPDLKLGIEYQGEQHYIARKDWSNGDQLLLESKIRDEQKRQYCVEEGIHLIEIKYDWKMDIDVLIKALKDYL